MDSKQKQGKFAGWNNTNTNFGAVGDNAQGTLIAKPNRKTCKICYQEVGIDHQNNCQCQRESNYCGYCEENEVSRKNCTCHTKKLEMELKTDADEVKTTTKKLEKIVSDEPIASETKKEIQKDDQEIITEINSFLRTKYSFLQSRQTTIKELKECCNRLEKFINEKHANISEIGNTVSSVVGSITNVVTFGIPKVIGESIKSGANFSKIRFSGESSNKFQVFLVSDKDELVQLKNTYDSLVKVINNNKNLEIVSELENILNLKNELGQELKLFNQDYKIFDVLTDEGIWENRPLDPEKMATAIKTLSKNWKELRKELEQQVKDLKDIIGEENINLEVQTRIHSLQFKPNQEQELQRIIKKFKEFDLKQLIDSAKGKLKSQSKGLTSATKHKERDDKLESFFKNFSTNQDEFVQGLEKIKKDLSRKLSWEEINKLCQTKAELESLQQVQSRVQIPPKSS